MSSCTLLKASATSRLPVKATAAQAWALTGDWAMKWAALDNVEIPNDKERTIKTKGGDIYEKLIERDEAKMYYSWSYNFPAAFGDFGTNIWGSLQVTTDKEGGSRSKTFVSYSMNSDVISQAEVDRLNPLMKHEVEDVGAKLVKYIEANI